MSFLFLFKNSFAMELFATFKDRSIKDPVLRLIKCKPEKVYKDSYKLYTYIINKKKNKNEDDMYYENPDLLTVLTRACSIVTYKDSIVTGLEGPYKFSGLHAEDEDPEDEDDDPPPAVAFVAIACIEEEEEEEEEELNIAPLPLPLPYVEDEGGGSINED